MTEYKELAARLRAYGGNDVRDYRHQAASAIEALEAELDEARRELAETREICSLVRRQDYFDVPTPVLVEAQIESAVWRALTDAAEATSERRKPVDNVLNRYRLALQENTNGG